MNTVAVEQGLHPVKQYLEECGCHVVEFASEGSLTKDAADASVIVLTGGDENFMGMDDTLTKVPVVSAEGLSPEEIYHRIEHFLN